VICKTGSREGKKSTIRSVRRQEKRRPLGFRGLNDKVEEKRGLFHDGKWGGVNAWRETRDAV